MWPPYATVGPTPDADAKPRPPYTPPATRVLLLRQLKPPEQGGEGRHGPTHLTKQETETAALSAQGETIQQKSEAAADELGVFIAKRGYQAPTSE